MAQQLTGLLRHPVPAACLPLKPPHSAQTSLSLEKLMGTTVWTDGKGPLPKTVETSMRSLRMKSFPTMVEAADYTTRNILKR